MNGPILDDRDITVRLAARHQHHQHGGDHDLVGDRVEELAEARDLSLGAGEITVEIIGDSDDAVEDEGDRVVVRRGLPEEEDEDRNREDARQREQVGQRQHRPALYAKVRFEQKSLLAAR
jgi:hypothetical protein